MLVDSFLPEGFTRLAVDSIFMMPQLGVLSSFNKTAATQVFDKDCMVYLGSCIAPVGKVKSSTKPCVHISGQLPDGTKIDEMIAQDELRLWPMAAGTECELLCKPVKGFDLGAGNGAEMKQKVYGGVVGLIVDTRGRPFNLTSHTTNRLEKLAKWDITKV